MLCDIRNVQVSSSNLSDYRLPPTCKDVQCEPQRRRQERQTLGAIALPVVDLRVIDRHATELDRAAVCELIHGRASDVEGVPARRVDGEDVDAPARLGVRELPAGAAVRGVEVGEESAADVREGGEAVEGREAYKTGQGSPKSSRHQNGQPFVTRPFSPVEQATPFKLLFGLSYSWSRRTDACGRPCEGVGVARVAAAVARRVARMESCIFEIG